MSTQLHKNFTDNQVKSFLKSYLDKEIKISYILQMLKIKRRRFFEFLTNIAQIRIAFLFNLKEKQLIGKYVRK